MGNNTSYIVLLITYLHNGINTPSLSSCQHCPPIGHQTAQPVLWLVGCHYPTPTPSHSTLHTISNTLLVIHCLQSGEPVSLSLHIIFIIVFISKCCFKYTGRPPLVLIFLSNCIFMLSSTSTVYNIKGNGIPSRFLSISETFIYFEAEDVLLISDWYLRGRVLNTIDVIFWPQLTGGDSFYI